MNSKKVLNRILPLIIALAVILIVAISCTVFSGSNKAPKIDDPNGAYLSVDLGNNNFGEAQTIVISRDKIYNDLKTQSGLQVLVDLIDTKLLTDKNYIQKVTDDEIKEAVVEAIFPNGYDSEETEYDDAITTIKAYIDRMYVYYGIEINKDHIEIDNQEIKVTLTGEDNLAKYYRIILARKAFARERLEEDQKENYEKFIDEYEEYLADLYEYEQGDTKTAPTKPTEGTTITAASVQSNHETNNIDSYWTLFVTYQTEAEAQKALLQEGVVIFSSTWYRYDGIDPATHEPYTSSHYTAATADVHALDRYEIMEVLIRLYNNAYAAKAPGFPNALNPSANLVLKDGTHYEKKKITSASYEALEAADKVYYTPYIISIAEFNSLAANEKVLYTFKTITAAEYKKLGAELSSKYVVSSTDSEEYQAYEIYRGVIFKTEVVNTTDKDDKVVWDEDATENTLYYTKARLTAVDSSIFSYIKSLSSAYTEGVTWTKTYTNSIQTKGNYYIVGVKLSSIIVETYEQAYGTLYDEDAYEEDGTISNLGYIKYTLDADGNKVFDYENDKYWAKVLELLDNSVSSAIINNYMAELRNDYGLIIYDDSIETSYTSTYTSDYKTTKKNNSTIVAKLNWKDDDNKKQTFEVSAQEIFNVLEENYGALAGIDSFQYEYVLYQNEVIDYAKYKAGASLKNSVIITEYALAKKGTTDPVTSWTKVTSEGTITFKKMNATEEYDVLVRTRTSKGTPKIVTDSSLTYVADDSTSTKTNIVLTVYADETDDSPETKFNDIATQIETMKLSFSNGSFESEGYPASYGWKNFLRDYFKTMGLTVTNNDELKLYYIYEMTVSKMMEDLSAVNGDNWNEYYLPFMQNAYDKYFSVNYTHFLIYVLDSKGSISSMKDADTAWTDEQKAASEELYQVVYQILKKSRPSNHSSVLEKIVTAFNTSPKFIADIAYNTASQQAHINIDGIYYDTYYDDSQIEYTVNISGIDIKVSEYKSLGLVVKTESGTATADQMVSEFEKAVRDMWLQQEKADTGMQEGTALETTLYYDDMIDNSKGEFLTTQYGYHVLVATKFTARSVKDKVIIGLPSYENVLIYEKDGEEVDDLTDLEIASIENYYSLIKTDFENSAWFQLNMVKNALELVTQGKFDWNTSNNAKATRAVEYYVDSYQASLTYLKNDYDLSLALLKAATLSMEIAVKDYNNVTVENMGIINASVAKAFAKVTLTLDKYTQTQIDDFNEAKQAYDDALAAYNVWLTNQGIDG